MLSRLNASVPRALLRRSFAALPPPPPAARSRQGLALATLSAGIVLGGYLYKADRPTVSLLSAPLMLESPTSTPKSTEAPIPAPPPTTTAKDTDQVSQIGKGPAVESRETSERSGGSEFGNTDVAGDSVGGTKPNQTDGGAVVDESSVEGGSSKGTGDPKTQGAFNEETGEINWDCPCLGGMPHGPCGPQFRAAFSCFVYSEEEPKGIECVEKFKDMQECFRAHPDVYGESDYEDDEAEPSLEAEQSALEPIESQLMDDPSKPFEGASDERGELFAQDGGVTGEGIGTKTE